MQIQLGILCLPHIKIRSIKHPQPKMTSSMWVLPRETVETRRKAEDAVLLKGLPLHNDNTHKEQHFHCYITVPPGGQTALFPSVTECYFLFPICINAFEFCFVFWCDHLEMSSKSNILICCVAVWRIKSCYSIIKSKEVKGNILATIIANVLYQRWKNIMKNIVLFIRVFFIAILL